MQASTEMDGVSRQTHVNINDHGPITSHNIAQQIPGTLGTISVGAASSPLSPQSQDKGLGVKDDAARIELLNDLNEVLMGLYDDTTDFQFQLEYYQGLSTADDVARLGLLEMSLAELSEMVQGLELASPKPSLEQMKLISRIYYLIFSKTGLLPDIQKAIDSAKDSVMTLNSDSPEYTDCSRNLIVMLISKSENTFSTADLDEAIHRAEEMIRVKSLNKSDLELAEADLSQMKSKRALWMGVIDGSDDDEEPFTDEEEMSMDEEFDVVKSGLDLVERTGNLDYLEKIIQKCEEDVESTSTNDPGRVAKLNNLAISLRLRFDNTGKLADLDRAIQKCNEAMTVISQEDAKKIEVLSNLALFLDLRFEKTGNLDDIQKAIQIGEEVVAMASYHGDIPRWAGSLSNLASSLRNRFSKTGDLDDLQASIQKGEEAVAATPLNDPHRPGRLNNLIICFQTRFDNTGSLEDLQMAIEKGEELESYDHPHRAAMLNNLATAFHSRFERTDNLGDLQMAIQRNEEAIAITPHGHLDRSSMLNNLAMFLRTKFNRTNNLDDLQMAIQRGEESVAETPHYDPRRPGRLNNLAASFRNRFNRTGNLDDLQEAIRRGKESVELTPHDHPYRAGWLNNLAVSFRMRFTRTDNINDLDLSIQTSEEAIAKTRYDHPNRIGMLASLTTSLRARFNRAGDLDDLQKAIQKAEEVVAIMPHDHLNRAVIIHNLAACFETRFDRTDNLDDLQIAIQRSEEAVAMAPHDHPDRSAMVGSLAAFLQTRFGRTGEPSDSERATRFFQEAAALPRAPPRDRIKSARFAATLLASNNMPEASRMMETAVRLLPLIAPRQLKQRDQQHTLGEFAGLASIAAFFALEAGEDACHAVRLLESGRGVITGSRFGTRSDLTELREQHPEIAEEFERLRSILDPPNSKLVDLATDASAALQNTHQRNDANLNFNKIVEDIRLLPSFENFLQPPQADELMAAASLGPVVLINVSNRCDAFLIEKEIIRSIYLPNLHESDIKENAMLIRTLRAANLLSSDAVSKMHRVLEWLWDVAVRPILDSLGFLTPRLAAGDDDLPRIWWIPTGQLSLLPLHAAGYHSSSSTDTTLDKVVSSYSSSVKALLYSRRISRTVHELSGEALLVSMDKTPGHSDLNFAKEEINMLETILPDDLLKVKLERPCKRDILDHLSTCSIFHFAGHGESDSSDPSKSSLLASDWEDNPLTMENLIGLDFSQKSKSPWLAYLSACSTGDSDAEKLPDEALHLVTACQLAGFQNVVGSLWEVSDRYSVNAAEEIYKTIRDSGAVDGKGIALGVHKATRLLRDIANRKGKERFAGPAVSMDEMDVEEGEERGARAARRVRPLGYEKKEESEGGNPLIWAAYIHVGP